MRWARHVSLTPHKTCKQHSLLTAAIELHGGSPRIVGSLQNLLANMSDIEDGPIVKDSIDH